MAAIDSAIGGSAAWAALGVAAYLALGLVATAVSAHLEGAVARVGRAALRLYPRAARTALRMVVAGAVGLGAGIGAGSTAAAADADHPGPVRSPVVATALPHESLDWPVQPAARPPRQRPAQPVRIVVRPGDSLWRLAARAL